MHRPLWGVALVYTGGIVASYWIAVPLTLLLCLFAGLLAGAILASKHRLVFLAGALFLAGWTNFSTRTAIVSPHDLRVLIGNQPELVTVRGRIDEPPTQSVYQRDTEDESWRTHAVVVVESIARHGDWQPASGTVAITSPGVLGPEFATGRRVEIFGIVKPPRGPLAEGLFDYRAYLRLRGIHFQLQTKELADWKLVDGPAAPSLTDRFTTWAQPTLQRGLPIEDEPLRLSWAMALGWKTALTDEVSEPFMRTGTMHIFAISGLHVALIAGILVALLRVARLPRSWCGIVAIPLIWFYTAATGWQSSAIRSTVMMSIIIAGWSLRRPTDLLNSLGAAGFIILVWQPEQLFQASFQLSFFVVLSIALFLPPIEQLMQRLLASDPLLPPELRPRWQRWFDVPLRWVALSFATSLASWIGSMPLTAYYFHLFTPISLGANLVIVPLSSGALACNLGSLLCAPLPWLTELFNHAGWFLMWLMAWLSEWFARWPGAFWHVRAPNFAETGAYFGIVIAVISGWALREKRWRWFVPATLGVIAILLFARWWPARHETRLTILPLSGGEAFWVDAPGRADDFLIDCGNERSATFVMKPFLRAQAVNRLPLIALTHGDLRNVGGWQFIATEFKARQTATSPARFRSAEYRRILGELAEQPAYWRQVKRGDQFGPWRILHPADADKFTNADDAALVLLGEINGTRVLLLSDLGPDGQRSLLQREPELRADIVVAGLPQKGEPLIDPLLATLHARAVIITDSEFPATQRAGKGIRDRLGHHASSAIFTSDRGALTLTLRPEGWSIRDVEGVTVNSELHR